MMYIMLEPPPVRRLGASAAKADVAKDVAAHTIAKDAQNFVNFIIRLLVCLAMPLKSFSTKNLLICKNTFYLVRVLRIANISVRNFCVCHFYNFFVMIMKKVCTKMRT